jgi:hypothetical protein
MKRMMFTTALAISAIWATAELLPVQAQQVVLAPQPYLYAAPVTTYYPTAGYTTVRTYRKRGPLRLLPRRDEVVTTSYVQAPQRVAPYSTSVAPIRTYAAPVQTYTTTTYQAPIYVAPAPTYIYPARIGGWYR